MPTVASVAKQVIVKVVSVITPNLNVIERKVMESKVQDTFEWLDKMAPQDEARVKALLIDCRRILVGENTVHAEISTIKSELGSINSSLKLITKYLAAQDPETWDEVQ